VRRVFSCLFLFTIFVALGELDVCIAFVEFALFVAFEYADRYSYLGEPVVYVDLSIYRQVDIALGIGYVEYVELQGL
jgi:hypothetical protein